MRYAASEKLEIIKLVEESHLSTCLTLAELGTPRTTFIAGTIGTCSVAKLDCWTAGPTSQAKACLEPHS
jgi:hypothetical protein